MFNSEFHLVVPAAGIGSRFGSGQPKQYALIDGRPMIHHAIESCIRGQQCRSITVALSKDDHYWQSPNTHDVPLTVVCGGKERSDSVLAALLSLREQGLADTDYVLVHDAARPYLPSDDIRALLSALATVDAALLAAPVADTLKQVAADGRVEKTVDRSSLWRALTPQAAPLGLLIHALQYCLERGVAVTDEASALEAAGYQVQAVAGSPANIKVTLAEDLITVAGTMAGTNISADPAVTSQDNMGANK